MNAAAVATDPSAVQKVASVSNAILPLTHTP